MFAALRLLLLVALAPACSVVNADHCANQDGDATCKQRDPDRPYCSQCVGDNNGCLAAIPEDSCHAVTVAQPASSSTTATTTGSTTSDDPTTTSVSQGDTSTSTSTAPTTSSSSSTTDDPSTSSSTGTTDATTTDDTTSTSTTSTDSSSTSTGSSDDTGSDSSSSTGADPVCGDNTIEGDEVCDGTKLDGQTCAKLLPNKWGGGTLKCNNTCKSFDDTDCCIGVGQPCNYLLQPDELCCGGLNCPLSGKCTVKP